METWLLNVGTADPEVSFLRETDPKLGLETCRDVGKIDCREDTIEGLFGRIELWTEESDALGRSDSTMDGSCEAPELCKETGKVEWIDGACDGSFKALLLCKDPDKLG